MSTTRAQKSDWPELEALYQRNHFGAYRGLEHGGWRRQTFVMRHDADPGELEGFAQASYAGLRKSRRHGVISVFEIDPQYDERWRPLLERSLVKTCVAWLAAQWCTWAEIPALRNQKYAWLARELGVGSGGFGAISIRPHHPQWEWVLDPQTGMVYPEAPPEGRPPGSPPKPFQAARRIWA